jgi:3-oxosteroid 1-dehydrogenase
MGMTGAGSAGSSGAGRVVVVGGGLSGIAAALGAALQGLEVTVVEAADQLGGAAAWSGGQVWVGANHVAARDGVADDLGRTEAYVRGIAEAHPELLDEEAMLRWLTLAPRAVQYWEDAGAVTWTVIPGLADYHADVPGALPAGRYLTAMPMDGRSLGHWRDRLRVSPWFRPGTTYDEMFAEGRRRTAGADAPPDDPLALGTGLVAGFLARALREPRIEFLLRTRVTDLLQEDDGRVVGVRGTGPAGVVERTGAVVLATSSFDWEPKYVSEFLGIGTEDFASMAPETLRGDGITLARAAGGSVVRFPPTGVPMVPGWRLPDGQFVNGPEYAMPHAMIVDGTGRRFANDSFWVDLVSRALDPQDPHLPMYLIWDEQHHRAYGLGGTPPGGSYPDGLVTSAPTIPELGAALGIDGAQLAATAAEFSVHAEWGEDPRYGRGTVETINRFSGDPDHRPSPVLGPITEAPFHGLRLVLLGVGIGSSGVRADAHGRVLDEAGDPVAGLYAIGSCAAGTTFGSGYNSGMALSRGLTLAYSVAEELGAQAADGSRSTAVRGASSASEGSADEG